MVVYQRLNKTSFLYYCVLLRGNLSRYAEIICGFSPALIKLMVCFEGFDLWELMMALLTLLCNGLEHLVMPPAVPAILLYSEYLITL